MSGQPHPTHLGQLVSPCSIPVGELRVQAALFTVCGLQGVSLDSNLAHTVCGSTFAQCEQVFNPVLNVEGTTGCYLNLCAVYLGHVESTFQSQSSLQGTARPPPPAGSGTLVSHMACHCQHYLRALYGRSPLYLLVCGQAGRVWGDRSTHVDGRPSRRGPAWSWGHWRPTVGAIRLLLQRLHRCRSASARHCWGRGYQHLVPGVDPFQGRVLDGFVVRRRQLVARCRQHEGPLRSISRGRRRQGPRTVVRNSRWVGENLCRLASLTSDLVSRPLEDVHPPQDDHDPEQQIQHQHHDQDRLNNVEIRGVPVTQGGTAPRS